MPSLKLVVEVVSLGEFNRDRDYVRKRSQYAAVGIPEYWIIDSQTQQVTVLTLADGEYQNGGIFAGEEAIFSPAFPDLGLTAAQVF